MLTKDFSPEGLSERRLKAVRLRLDGHSIAQVSQWTGLSTPTVSAAWRAFREGGWMAVPLKPRGRKTGQASVLNAAQQARLWDRLGTLPPGLDPGWNRQRLAAELQESDNVSVSPRTIDHWLAAQGLKPAPLALAPLERRRNPAGRWYRQQVRAVAKHVATQGGQLWRGGVAALGATLPRYRLHLHGKRDSLYLCCLSEPPRANDYQAIFQRLLEACPQAPVALLFHGAWFQASPEMREWFNRHPRFTLINMPAGITPTPDATQQKD